MIEIVYEWFFLEEMDEGYVPKPADVPPRKEFENNLFQYVKPLNNQASLS